MPGATSGPWPGATSGPWPGATSGPWPGATSGPCPGHQRAVARCHQRAVPGPPAGRARATSGPWPGAISGPCPGHEQAVARCHQRARQPSRRVLARSRPPPGKGAPEAAFGNNPASFSGRGFAGPRCGIVAVEGRGTSHRGAFLAGGFAVDLPVTVPSAYHSPSRARTTARPLVPARQAPGIGEAAGDYGANAGRTKAEEHGAVNRPAQTAGEQIQDARIRRVYCGSMRLRGRVRCGSGVRRCLVGPASRAGSDPVR